MASTAVLHPHPDVRFVPIRDAPLVPLVMVWPRSNPHPHTREFVANAREVMRAQTAPLRGVKEGKGPKPLVTGPR